MEISNHGDTESRRFKKLCVSVTQWFKAFTMANSYAIIIGAGHLRKESHAN